jgi:hypothetical protein
MRPRWHTGAAGTTRHETFTVTSEVEAAPPAVRRPRRVRGAGAASAQREHDSRKNSLQQEEQA